MKRLSILSVLLLAACGGGGGAPSPIVTPEEVRAANLQVSSIVDNESRRSAHVLKTLGADYYNDSGVAVLVRGASQQGNNICKSERDCNDLAFNNMKQWLIDNADQFDNWTDNRALRQALKLAGFGNVLAGNWDDIKEWARTHHNEIVNQAHEIYNELGTHRDFDITQSDFTVVNTQNDYPHKIIFQLDNNNKIANIELKTDSGSIYEQTILGTRNNDSTTFTFSNHMHVYTLGNIGETEGWSYDPAADGRRDIEVESKTPLSLGELKQKLREIANWEKERGDDGFFGSFHNCRGGAYTCVDDVYNATIAQIEALDSLQDEHLRYDVDDDNFTADLDSYGKTVGLAYSDFGNMVIHNEDGTNYVPYHGGYNSHKISEERMNQLAQTIESDMTFSGKATGNVTARRITNWDGDPVSEKPDLGLSGDATLVFSNNGTNTGAQTLNMAFNNWYDVRVTKDSSGESINFSNYTNNDNGYKFVIAGQNPTPRDEYTVHDFTRDTQQFDTNNDGVSGDQEGALRINYYAGDSNSTPSEASGFVAYSESEPETGNEGGVINHIEFTSAFGGIRQY